MEYLSVKETAEKWNLSDRMVQQFCVQGRIPGAQKFGKSWAVPANAEKPKDPRKTQGQPADGAASLMGDLLDHARLMPLTNPPFQ